MPSGLLFHLEGIKYRFCLAISRIFLTFLLPLSVQQRYESIFSKWHQEKQITHRARLN